MEAAADIENVKSVWSDHGKIIALLNKRKKTTVVVDLKTDLKKPLKAKNRNTRAKRPVMVEGAGATPDADTDSESETPIQTCQMHHTENQRQQRDGKELGLSVCTCTYMNVVEQR